MSVQRFLAKLSYQMAPEPEYSVTPGALLGAIGGGLYAEGTVPSQVEIDLLQGRLDDYDRMRKAELQVLGGTRNAPSWYGSEPNSRLRMIEAEMAPTVRELRRLRQAKYRNRAMGVLGGAAAGGLVNAALNRLSRPVHQAAAPTAAAYSTPYPVPTGPDPY